MNAILHRIKAWLFPNALTTEDPNDFTARVSSEKSLNVRQVCEAAVERGGADVSAAAMNHSVELWLKEMAYQLCDGFNINADWFTAGVYLRGVYNSPNEHFNPEKHSVLFEFHQGAALRKELSNVTVDIMGVAETGPLIFQATDMKTGSVNDLLTPHYNLKVSGQKIKIAGDNPANGILFRSQDDPDSTYTVDASDIVTNNPSELMIVIPALIADGYTLEVTTQFSVGQLLKEPRTVAFDKVLTVQ
jgi:hypothetical protein